MRAASHEFLREFIASMPHGYKHAFSAEAVEDHARVAASRGRRLAGVGSFRSERDLGWPACIVADDRPGLLAMISAALVMHELDVVHAEAYTRKTPTGAFEAVDVFWLRRVGSAEQPAGDAPPELLTRLQETLERLLDGSLAPTPGPAPAPAQRGTGTVVRFIGGERGDLATLEVETSDRSGLLLALARALFRQRVQIVRSEVRTLGDKVQDRFTVTELDGSPIGSDRRLQIQVAVLSSLESAPD